MLSSSVANGFKTLRNMQLMKETERFFIMFDRYFDMMNTRAIDEGLRRRKPDLKAYYEDKDDSRFEACTTHDNY